MVLIETLNHFILTNKQHTSNTQATHNQNQQNMTSMATMSKQTRIQQNSNDETGISLCIPFVFKSVTKEKIFAVIRSMKVGHIERIDIVNVSDRQNKAFIHFAKGKWAYNENAVNILNDMKAGIPWIVPYCRTGFWKIGISTAEKPTQTQVNIVQHQQAPRHTRRKVIDISPPTHISNEEYWNVSQDVMSIIGNMYGVDDQVLANILSTDENVMKAYGEYVETGDFKTFKEKCEKAMENISKQFIPTPIERCEPEYEDEDELDKKIAEIEWRRDNDPTHPWYLSEEVKEMNKNEKKELRLNKWTNVDAHYKTVATPREYYQLINGYPYVEGEDSDDEEYD